MAFVCRERCGACCIAPSISSLHKPAGVPCSHLTPDLRCSLWGRPERPAVCGSLKPCHEMCGDSREEALAHLDEWERLTAPR
ncbi:MAG TPA: YkgJ family cysteine cluster protein [Spirochaetia bacterium]|nr:YkgJ family cysteine cluster protein [Spirochaetia bacterium]